MTKDDKAPAKGSTGKMITTVGAAMIAGSIILALVGVQGATFHNVLQLGGIAIGIVGIVIWRVLKM